MKAFIVGLSSLLTAAAAPALNEERGLYVGLDLGLGISIGTGKNDVTPPGPSLCDKCKRT